MEETSKNYNSYTSADLFQATVVSSDPGTNIVIVAPDGQSHGKEYQGIPLASTLSSAVGFVESILPGVGTKVLCQGRQDGTALILGCIPPAEMQGKLDSPGLHNKAILGAKETGLDSVHSNGYLSNVTKSRIFNNNLPTDIIAGEKVIGNEFGVMLGLFKLLATLKASELAQVQVHFLDDLVRIISHNFQHFTSLGELKVFHDGKGIHLEAGATHKPKESLGQSEGASWLAPDDSITPPNEVYQLSDDQLVMLERMKMFVGQLGQFVNLLIVNPSQEPHTLNGNAPQTPDTGLLQIKASLDGNLVVRSVKGIYLEKTNWIRVPTRIRTPEDPLGDDGTTIEYPEQKDYEFTKDYQYRDVAFLYYLQLRDYLAYINEDIGYTNFKAHKKDFYVNDDKANETPLESITYVDQETGITYTQTKSWISLMSNGGISLADAWGSCFAMEGGNIYIQPAKDLIVQPNRNLIAKVGGNVSVAARKEIDLSSTEGGMRVKTNNTQHLYSKEGGIVLHTDAQNVTTQTYPNSKMVTAVAGIVLNAPNASINSYARQVYNYALDTYVTRAQQLTLNSTGITRVMSDNSVQIYGDNIYTMSDVATVNYSKGNLISLGLTGTVVGLKGQNFGLANAGAFGEVPVEGFLDPANNQDAEFFDNLASQITDLDNFDMSTMLESFKEDTDFTDLQFEFPPTQLYGISKTEDVIPQTLSQQTDELNNTYGLQPWQEAKVNSSYPYPGIDFADSLVSITVNNIDSPEAMLLANKAVDLVTKSTAIVENIFDNYKSF